MQPLEELRRLEAKYDITPVFTIFWIFPGNSSIDVGAPACWRICAEMCLKPGWGPEEIFATTPRGFSDRY
jgi:hypothetical protein